MVNQKAIIKWLKETHGNVSTIGFNYIVRVMELLINNEAKTLQEAYKIVTNETNKQQNNAEKVITTYRKKTKYALSKNKEFIHLLIFDFYDYNDMFSNKEE